jgi:glycosyltransferase involved in cell wall biosynthesis
MRILVAAGQWFPDKYSGYARVVTDTAKGLARLGNEVTVIVPRQAGLPRVEQEGSLVLHRELRRSAIPLTLTDIVETARSARGLHARFDVALAQSENLALGVLGADSRLPVAFVYHHSTALEVQFDRARLPLGPRRAASRTLEAALVLIERAAVGRSQRVLVLSDYTRSMLDADHPRANGKTRLLSGGVDADWFTPGAGDERARLGIEEGATLLFTVRRLEPRMGLENLLDAMRLLPESVQLAIAGDGALAAELRERARDLTLDGRVRFVGRVSEESLRDWYRAATLFVLPTVAYEGFGMVTAEALACGTPVVGTPVGATPELLEPLEPSLVAAGAAPEDLAAAVEAGLAVATPQLRERSRAYAVERFSWEAVIPGWEAALAEIRR